jgi:septal ring factor EnvC (AmiA/AmiB activator)
MVPESLWTSEAEAVQEQAEEGVAEEMEPRFEHVSFAREPEEAASLIALAVSADEFSALEERVLRAVEMLKHERQARAAAEVRVAEAEDRARQAEARFEPVETQLREQMMQVDQLRGEISSLRAEREAVRHRVDRLLGQLDALEI